MYIEKQLGISNYLDDLQAEAQKKFDEAAAATEKAYNEAKDKVENYELPSVKVDVGYDIVPLVIGAVVILGVGWFLFK